ncbi:MAG: hypothetical protein LBG93_09640 [Treponema sp.]|jgi:iron complex transport system substrate-binding protein|nr:hypothetical protein [Treponema sp.]
MKKILSFSIVLALTIALSVIGTAAVFANPAQQQAERDAWQSELAAFLAAKEPAISVVLNGQPFNPNVSPQLVNGVPMVPLSAMFEALGAAVTWNSNQQTAYVTHGNTTAAIPVGRTGATLINNASAPGILTPAVILDGDTFVSAQAVARFFNIDVVFRPQNMTVYIGQIPEFPGYTRITDQLGIQHFVIQNPKRIAVFDDGFLDLLMSVGFGNLGLEKVGVTFDPANPPAWFTYEGDVKFVRAGTLFQVHFEAMDYLQPQLVITQARTFGQVPHVPDNRPGYPITGMYRQASQLRYPVAFARLSWSTPSRLVENLNNWVDSLSVIFPAAASRLQAEKNGVMAEIAEIASQTGNYTALFIQMTTATGLGIQLKNSRFDQIYDAFGFQAAAPANSLAGVANQWDVRAQWILDHNPDVIFLLNRGAAMNAARENLLSDPRIQQTTAFINGHIIYNLPMAEWYTTVNGLTSIRRMIYDVNRFLNAR